MRLRTPRGPFVISATYFVFGFLWILLSDMVLAQLSPTPEFYMRVQTYKGWIYVFLTTGLIFALTFAYARGRERMLHQLKLREREAHKNAAEKEILLGEVHHRVKNNLQVIQSLVRLNAGKPGIDGPKLVTELLGRIEAIAAIHEQIFTGGAHESLDLKAFIDTLAARVAAAVSSHTIKVEKEMEDAMIGIEAAVPYAVIVNEVLTNAFKYAFPDGESGTIRIALRREGENLILEIEDNGAGFESAQESFGTTLTRSMVEQLGGRMVLESSKNGTRFQLSVLESSLTAPILLRQG